MRGLLGRREVVALLVAAVVTWTVLGTSAVLVVVVLAVVVAIEGLQPASRHAALGAAGCLLAAAVGTVVERSLAGAPRLQFATDRPFTAAVGSLAGGLLLGSMVLGWAARDQRAPTSCAHPRRRGSSGS